MVVANAGGTAHDSPSTRYPDIRYKSASLRVCESVTTYYMTAAGKARHSKTQYDHTRHGGVGTVMTAMAPPTGSGLVMRSTKPVGLTE